MEEQKVHNQAMAKVFIGTNFVLFLRICPHNCFGIIRSYSVYEVYSLMAHASICVCSTILFFPLLHLHCSIVHFVSSFFFAIASLPNVLDVC